MKIKRKNRNEHTFLKADRTIKIFPKPWIKTDCRDVFKNVGNIRWILFGNKCQSKWLLISFELSNELQILSPNSHIIKTIANDQNISLNKLIRIIGLWKCCDWNWQNEITNKYFVLNYWFQRKKKKTQPIQFESLKVFHK